MTIHFSSWNDLYSNWHLHWFFSNRLENIASDQSLPLVLLRHCCFRKHNHTWIFIWSFAMSTLSRQQDQSSCSGVCRIDSTNQVKICSIVGTNNGWNSYQLLPRYATKPVRWELAEWNCKLMPLLTRENETDNRHWFSEMNSLIYNSMGIKDVIVITLSSITRLHILCTPHIVKRRQLCIISTLVGWNKEIVVMGWFK